jgi:hypothetical protein
MMERNTVVAIAAALCIAPSAVCNVLPHVQAITDASGHINSASTGMATMQAVSVMAMAGMPFAVEKFNAVGLKFGGYLLGLVLLCINFTNALDVADAVRKSSTSDARTKIEKAKALRADIAQYKADKAAIPAHDIVTADSVSVARTAVSTTQSARDLECRWRANTACREKETALEAANAALAKIARDRDLTERADAFDGKIAAAQKELTELGPLPKYADPTSAKLIRIVAVFYPVPANADDDVSEWLSILWAFGVEFLAFMGPKGIWAGFASPATQRSAGHARVEIPLARMQASGAPLPASAPLQELQPASDAPKALPRAKSVRPPATAKPRAKKKSAAKAEPRVDSLPEWFKARTFAKAGNEVRAGVVYEDYISWCGGHAEEPVSFTKFGTIMKKELGVGSIERSKRSFYVGIALTGALEVVSG